MSLRRETKEKPPLRGQRRRDQWTCAGVPRHHGDLLATSRNKMATLPSGITERWRQNHVRLLLARFHSVFGFSRRLGKNLFFFFFFDVIGKLGTPCRGRTSNLGLSCNGIILGNDPRSIYYDEETFRYIVSDFLSLETCPRNGRTTITQPLAETISSY